jgi:hypothetical protein
MEITSKVDSKGNTFSYESDFLPSLKGLIEVILTMYRFQETFIEGYDMQPYLTLHEVMGRALRGLSNEVISLLDCTTLESTHTADIAGTFNDALLLKVMGCRGNVAVFNSGRLAHRRPHSFTDTTAHALGRLTLPPPSMAIKVTENPFDNLKVIHFVLNTVI